MSMPSIEQITRLYLYGQDSVPADLKDPALIRPEGVGASIAVNMNEYMTTGGGRFITVANFRYVRIFLSGNDNAYLNTGGELAPGTYTRDELLEAYNIEKDQALGVTQSYLDLNSPDYMQRAYVFGSGEFIINEDAMFIVHPGGGREIQNICVEPKDDNFDFVGGDDSQSNTFNKMAKPRIDPSDIGRKVIIKFEGEVEDKFNYTDSDFWWLAANNSDFEAIYAENKILRPINNSSDFLKLWATLGFSDDFSYKDSEGRYIYFDGVSPDNSKNINGEEVLSEFDRFLDPSSWSFNGVALIAGGGNDTLSGIDGDDDEFYGGKGDDLYYVSDKGDKVIEYADEGIDEIRSKVSYVLPAQVENLTLLTTTMDDIFGSLNNSINGTGNALSNYIKGTKGKNTLDGGKGDTPDTLEGGGGNDTYLIHHEDDLIIEYADEGTDEVRADVSYVLPEHVENLVLIGTSSINGTGNSADNIIIGNDGNNILDGKGGRDLLMGGKGFDTYYADNGDFISDFGGQGQIYLNGNKLTGGTRKKGETAYSDGTNFYLLQGETLTITDSRGRSLDALTIEGFNNKSLGIYLDEEEEDDDLKPPPYNPDQAVRPYYDPLALDLNGNGTIDDTTLTGSRTYFDLTGDGIAEKTAWIGGGDGLLAFDANGNGVIDNVSELFADDQTWANGFGKLSALFDSNNDGQITAEDTRFSELRIWQDANGDGISQAGELKSLTDWGITALNTKATPSNTSTANGNQLIATGSFTRDGQDYSANALLFAYNPALTDANPQRPQGQAPELRPEIFTLPWLRGFGLVKSLHIAYQEQPELQQLAEKMVSEGHQSIVDNFDSFMARWSGLTAAQQAKGISRTTLTTADKIWMLETFNGVNVHKSAIENGNFSPGNWDENYINTQWQDFASREMSAFFIQTLIGSQIKGVDYSLNKDRFIVTDATLVESSLATWLSSVKDAAGVFGAVRVAAAQAGASESSALMTLAPTQYGRPARCASRHWQPRRKANEVAKSFDQKTTENNYSSLLF